MDLRTMGALRRGDCAAARTAHEPAGIMRNSSAPSTCQQPAAPVDIARTTKRGRGSRNRMTRGPADEAQDGAPGGRCSLLRMDISLSVVMPGPPPAPRRSPIRPRLHRTPPHLTDLALDFASLLHASSGHTFSLASLRTLHAPPSVADHLLSRAESFRALQSLTLVWKPSPDAPLLVLIVPCALPPPRSARAGSPRTSRWPEAHLGASTRN
ncbi:hypothetical protein B0H14DRAFT_3865197 [Mycena olivaceomarginata]|nr:hypothetical protein B0H14DRAFT_3865197 [Mycena olivaceomarginata]